MKTLFTFLIIIFSFNVYAQRFQVTESSFKTLFNNYRVAQPEVTPWAGSFFPYSQHGTAVKVDEQGIVNLKDPKARSAIETYDKIANLTGINSSESWEKENHSCDKLNEKDKAGCEGWWGHCNAWAAAAIKEKEPTLPLKIGDRVLSVADQKGILTEVWMGTNSLFAGTTDKSIETGSWVVDDINSERYKKFWDVSPRTFFMIFTNYVGIKKTGVVIDRFAGDQVWNQPIVGYRILPLIKDDIKSVTKEGKTVYTAKINMKIYWANDLGTPPGHISAPFNIEKDTLDEAYIEHLPKSGYSPDYEGRLLSFELAFDGPVQISDDGKTILEAGNMLGEGIWSHQMNATDYIPSQLNQTHPDFIWLPTNAFQDFSGYGNPRLDPELVSNLFQSGKIVKGKTVSKEYLIPKSKFKAEGELTEEEITKKLRTWIRRSGVRVSILSKNVVFEGDSVKVKVIFKSELDIPDLEVVLNN